MSDKGKIFIIDMDSTITQCTEKWIEILNKTYNINLDKNEINSFEHGIPNILAKALSVNVEQANKITYDIIHNKDFFGSHEPIENSIDVINIMIEKYNDTIVIGTKPPPLSLYAYSEKYNWIQKYFSKHKNKIKFIGTSDKQFIRGEYLIDDAIHNIENSKGIHKTILYSQPWNTQYSGADYIVSNWNEILNLRDSL